MTKENSKYDTANISYVERGGASAMFIARDDQDKRYYRMNGSTYYGVPPAGFLPRRTSTNTKKKAVIQDASADKRPAISTKPKIKYDAAYISYVENGESACRVHYTGYSTGSTYRQTVDRCHFFGWL
jgi:hypothetical protein